MATNLPIRDASVGATGEAAGLEAGAGGAE
jgi:hypothetical protein